MIRPGFCLGRENVVYLYTRRVLGVVKANTGNSIMLCMAHMSGALLLYPLTLKQGQGDHISMCGCIVVHWSSMHRLQDTSLFMSLPSTSHIFNVMRKINLNIRPAWFSNSLMPLRISAGQLSLVRINEPADDETRPVESRHRGGSEWKLLPMRNTWHRAQEAGEFTDRFCHTWLSSICCIYHKAVCRSAATVYTVHIPVEHMLHTWSCLEISWNQFTLLWG